MTRSLAARLTVIVFATLMLVGVFGSLIFNHQAIRDVVAERNARHANACAAIPYLTFDSTDALHTYEQKITCPLVGTVPRGGGRPSIPAPTPSPTPTVTKAVPVPGPTTTATRYMPGPARVVYVPVTTTATTRVATVATVTVQVPVTVTKTCLPLLCG